LSAPEIEELWTWRKCSEAVEAEHAAVMRNELHMAHAAPADVAAIRALPPLFVCRLLLRLVVEERVVTLRQPLDSVAVPRETRTLLAANMV